MKRKGFSLVELMVVIAIIGILIAILLPAIQKARESANRATCANNMKQMALAAHGYHSLYGRFPGQGLPSEQSKLDSLKGWKKFQNAYTTLAAPTKAAFYPTSDAYFPKWMISNTSQFQFSVQSQLLPFLEQEETKHLIDFQKPLMSPWSSGGNQYLVDEQVEAAATPIKPYLCPSDPFAKSPFFTKYTPWLVGSSPTPCTYTPATGAGTGVCVPDESSPGDAKTSAYLGRYPVWAGTNYVACEGTGLVRIMMGRTVRSYDNRFQTDGMFYDMSQGTEPYMRTANIQDGTSHTIMFSECLLGVGENGMATPGRSMAQISSQRRPSPIQQGTYDPADPSCSAASGVGSPHDPNCAITDVTMTICDQNPGGTYNGDRGGSWIWGRSHRTGFNTYYGPNGYLNNGGTGKKRHEMDCIANGLGLFAARSSHSGGVNVAMADGSVTFASNDIAIDVWRALATPFGAGTTYTDENGNTQVEGSIPNEW